MNVPNAGGASHWTFEVLAEGTYIFSSTGPGSVPNHAGSFRADGGSYSLKASNIPWEEVGTYELPTKDTLVIGGKAGKGIWKRK